VIKLVVGLGNPGKEYERTRHNAGFWLVERHAQQSGVALRKDPKFKALVGKTAAGAWLLLPQSFMNLSGQPVQMLAGFFKIKPEEVLVVHDELDFPPGTAKLKLGGGVAGHNGLKDIQGHLGTPGFWRLRIGIGHPGDRDLVADYVLNAPTPDERPLIEAAAARALEVMPLVLAGDMQGAMQALHRAEKAAREKEKREASAPKPPPEAKE
jgi:PTH1 family peptidyl-tRNA hydrolase